ncbi:MAG: helix-turn-helix domain-containing protein, partial [Pseudomonadota bacterium]
IAGMTLVLGLLIPWIDQSVFVAVFAVLNGASFLPAMLLLVRYPDVLSRAEEALEMARAHSTLQGTDIPQKLRELTRLMSQDQLYRDESLNLAGLAEQLELSPHQTSELLNQHLGLGFSRFLRQHRVRDACRLLAEDRDASVLSIALAVGFSSQSTFYTAFREETGQSPGQYRRDPGGGATAN